MCLKFLKNIEKYTKNYFIKLYGCNCDISCKALMQTELRTYQLVKTPWFWQNYSAYCIFGLIVTILCL